MKCDADCDGGEEASIFFSYIENNKVVKVNLCKYCANEKGVNDPTGYSLIDLMQGMGKETTSGKESKARELTCADCGFTHSDFKKTGRFGCAKCYEVFSEGLEGLLEAMHKNTEHIGKVPSFAYIPPAASKSVEPASKSSESPAPVLSGTAKSAAQSESWEEAVPGPINLVILKDKLGVAIAAEDYEEAARLRDEIARLESKNFGHS
jgi:protein arginine kinase activator